jgi:subtilase family serine protease
MIPRLLAPASRALLAACLLATTLSAAGPAFAADKPDLRLMITPSHTQIAQGDTVDITFTVGNIGPVAVNSARLEATVTGAQSLSIVQQPSGQPNNCTLSGTALTCTKLVLAAFDPNSNADFADVVVRATASSTSTAKIDASGTADPNSNVDESDETNNKVDVMIGVIRLPDLKATIVDAPEYVDGGANVTFKVKVENLGGKADHIDLDFRTIDSDGLDYESVDFVDNVKHGFTCTMYHPWFDTNYVSCSGGSLGDPTVDPADDESVTLKIGASVDGKGLGPKDRTVKFTVDPNKTIDESNEGNNSEKFVYHYS